jgi:GT2 family glycosyltransferase
MSLTETIPTPAAGRNLCTVIVLNYDGEHLLPACLDSLVTQTIPVNVTVVDNASNDGSARLVAEKYPGIRFLALDKNYGFSRANNIGVRDAFARGSEYVLLLNNDTYAAPDFVAEMLRVMESDSSIAVVCPKIFFADLPERLWYAGGNFSLWTGITRHRGWKQRDHGQFDNELPITQATGCAMLLRREPIQKVGLLDEQFRLYAEDLDWSIRFAKHGYRLLFAPKSRLWHLDGATSVRLLSKGSEERRQFQSTRNMIFVFRKHVRWWQAPTFLVGFLCHHVAFYAMLRLWRRDFRAFQAIFRGLAEGVSTSLNPASNEQAPSAGKVII